MSGAIDFVLPDWSNDAPYLYTERFSGAQWSWEYLRRNVEFRADWVAAQTEYRLVGREGAITMLMSEHTQSQGLGDDRRTWRRSSFPEGRSGPIE